MRNILPYLFLLLSFSAKAQIENDIPSVPVPPRLVNDYTNTLSNYQLAELETKLKQYDDTTSNQIAVVIIDDLKGYPVEDFAIALGRKWGVGNKQFDNGIVILVCTGGGSGNRDLTIQIGYGLESVIPDITAKSIIDHDMIPYFKSGNMYKGLSNGVDALAQAAEGKYTAPAGWVNRGKGDWQGTIGAIIILVIVIIFVLGFFSNGGTGGGYVSRRGYTNWTGGGGWSGGSSSGGGFGGFGGGSFGGGGASGKW